MAWWVKSGWLRHNFGLNFRKVSGDNPIVIEIELVFVSLHISGGCLVPSNLSPGPLGLLGGLC
jgi:hypothetical protein